MSNRDKGFDAFKKFYEYQKYYHGKKVTYSFDELLNSYGNKKELFIEGWGDVIVNGSVSSSRLDSALLSLAKDSEGRMLKNPIQISNYIQNQSTKIDWVDAFAYVTTESVKDVGGAVAEVGNSLITTGKILTFLLPAIALVFVYYFINSKTDGQLTKAMKALKK